MKLAIDVHYDGDSATVAGVLFMDWESDEIFKSMKSVVKGIAAYESGSFYKRELPCLLDLISKVTEKVSVIIIDGFVALGNKQEPGLGTHLYRALDNSIPVIGVAKNNFSGTPNEYEVLRGNSANPLYVTSAGIDVEEAKRYIKGMHGNHRNPTLLKHADQLCRGIV